MSGEASVRDPREPPQDSPALTYSDELYDGREHLDRLRIHHLDLAGRFLRTGEATFSIDLVVAAVMSRSYSLVDGFLNAFDSWNLIVAAPLLRMQLDSLTRLAYLASAPRSDEVADYVIKGGEFRKLTDSEGKALTDARLIRHAEATHPWVKEVYQATSGWVHFSPAHVVASWQVKDDEEGGKALFGAIPIRAEQIPASALAEVLGAMIKATHEIFGYVEIWESRKGLPSGEMRELGEKESEQGFQ
jgi:hypothetical protein